MSSEDKPHLTLFSVTEATEVPLLQGEKAVQRLYLKTVTGFLLVNLFKKKNQ
jgi:hypothetical protein